MSAKYDYSTECCSVDVEHSDAISKAKATMPDEDTLYDVAELFKVFGDSTRTRILSALSTNELCVCDLARLLGMTKSAISHQLRILRTAKLVKFNRQGKEIYYSHDDSHVAKILAMAVEHVTE